MSASDFARGIVAIERGRQEDLPVGNLDVVRDLLDVRDGVEALWLLAHRGWAGDVYNICSGRGYSLRDVLSVYRDLARVEVRERLDPGRIRPIEEMVKVGDPAKLNALGWSPRRPIRRRSKTSWSTGGGRSLPTLPRSYTRSLPRPESTSPPAVNGPGRIARA